MLEFLLFILAGIGFGTFTGLVPGIHVNLICILLLGISSTFMGLNPYYLVALIISMSVTHTILDFIPSILLGCPEDSTALSVLPGHKMLLKGKGLEAIYLTIVGGIGVILFFVLMIPILIKIIPIFYETVKNYIHYILIAIVLCLILTEKGYRKLLGLFVFLISGLLGLIAFNIPGISSTLLFFPLFTGLFGISTLLISINSETKLPKQDNEIQEVKTSLVINGIVKAFFSGLLVGTLPGVGAAQATVLSQQITRKTDMKEFLVSIGGINTATAIFSLVALYTIGKPRSGAAVAVKKLVENFGINELILVVAAGLIATGIASLLALFLSKRFLNVMEKISYKKLSLSIIIVLIGLTIFLTGWIGILILFVSTMIGLLAPLLNVKRSFAMGVLMLPIILFYFGII